jgi:hypothetical protein
MWSKILTIVTYVLQFAVQIWEWYKARKKRLQDANDKKKEDQKKVSDSNNEGDGDLADDDNNLRDELRNRTETKKAIDLIENA